MSPIVGKTMGQIRPAIRNSPSLRLIFIQIQPFSSSLASIDQTPNRRSFTVNYLVNTCGLPLERAVRSSKRFSFETTEKPDSLIAFLGNNGFTKTQAANVIRMVPRLLVSNPKILLPKLEFFKSKGFSTTDVAKILSLSPHLLTRSLENQIIPSFNLTKNLIGSEEKTLNAIKRYANAGPLLVDLQSYMVPNVEILREVGVPHAKIRYLLINKPRVFLRSRERFRQTVEKVKGMGFDPMELKFVLAIRAINSMSKPTWEKKIEVYKSWGLSADEILVAFKKHPWFMTNSEGKIMRVMDFLVNEIGLDSSFAVERPILLSSSFEKRIFPRCLVYQELQAKGLIKKPISSMMAILHYPESMFIKVVVKLAKEEAPELLSLYQKKLSLAK